MHAVDHELARHAPGVQAHAGNFRAALDGPQRGCGAHILPSDGSSSPQSPYETRPRSEQWTMGPVLSHIADYRFADIRPAETIVDRGVDTCIGGALALLAYAVWPTWERSQAPTILADMLEAYRRYFAAVMAGYLDPQHIDAASLAAARRAARLARSNAEASIDRLRSEPARSPEVLDRAVGLLASSHRFVRSAMALEAGLYHDPDPPAMAPVALQDFVAAVDTRLRALIRALRDPSYRLTHLPD